MKGKVVILTDLDGTLLHPRTYSFDGAIPALNLIKERKIPLVFSSSKTRAEIEFYRERLANFHPFVSENGGGIFIPEGYFPFHIDGDAIDEYIMITLGSPYDEVRKIFSEIKKQLMVRVRGFGDMTVEEVSEVAGMTHEEAFLAKEREFDEPFIFNGDDKDKESFLRVVEERRFHWTEGRFLHILGNHDKGRAARLLIGFYKKVFGKVTTIGIGDSLNDLPLLREVDYPVLIPKEDGSYEPDVGLSNLVKAEGAGPEGWNKVVAEILREYNG